MCTCVRQVNDFLVIKTEFCNILKIKPNIYENNFSNYTHFSMRHMTRFIYLLCLKHNYDLTLLSYL